jgi:hypothetical protein
MKDLLQYVPYGLFVGAILLVLLVGVALTVKHFLKAEVKSVKR